MTISPTDLLIYAGALFILFLTPGPVWAALIARALSGGFHAAWPLALGVVVGDAIWPVLAVFGVTWLVSVYADFLLVLRYAGAIMLALMGALLIARAGRGIAKDARLTAPGAWAGFSAGVLIILGNPKAILFYMGVLPGFFDITTLNGWDIAAIATISMLVPLAGNVALAAFLGRTRALISSPSALRRINIGSGFALILVGIIIALS
ncbi:MAG: LysE family translocator [Alphaproteobacteria bacterium]|nr:LysE family translocator [Alphaproteobacteria bacterium]